MRKDLKILLIVIIAIAVIVGGAFGIRYAVVGSGGDEIIGEVTLSIRCDTINSAGLGDGNVPSDGTIITETKIKITSGYSAFSLISDTLKENKIQMDAETGTFVYIKGISNIYSGEYGNWSGWIFKYNDEYPSVACDKIILKDGDNVQMLFSCDGGADLGIVWG